MKVIEKNRLAKFIMLIALGNPFLAEASERNMLFNENWKFWRGSIANAEMPDFNDSKWRVLDGQTDHSISISSAVVNSGRI